MNPTLALLPTLPQPLTDGQAHVFSSLVELVSAPDGSWTLQPTELGREVLALMAERDRLQVSCDNFAKRLAIAVDGIPATFAGSIKQARGAWQFVCVTARAMGEPNARKLATEPVRVTELVRERDELRLSLLAERGEQTGALPGWEAEFGYAFRLGLTPIRGYVFLARSHPVGEPWEWQRFEGGALTAWGTAATAREAMRAAMEGA